MQDKYPNIFLQSNGTIVLIILQTFYTTPAVSKIGEYHLDIPQVWLAHIQSRDALKPVYLI